ncbi:TlpA family protein disulfide reductase [Halobacteriovorax sp.]|uniref:TlpA family protein disulfide reductase n=1 Tax=Halobacteriovorax sp. TaxID=2020862 RepID=UPI003AF2C2CE
MSTSSKISFIFIIVAITLGYSIYHKNKIDTYVDESRTYILKTLPSVELTNFEDNSPVQLQDLAQSSNGLVVHFWGTWCAPCEAEFPEFVEFARKLEEKNVKVVFMAVKDEDMKIKKFLKRFKDLPSNSMVIHDVSGISMSKLGVVKVPETFVFDSSLDHRIMFKGPQDWKMSSYFTRVLNYLGIN